MTIKLELVIHGTNGNGFLNYWDSQHANDVCAEIRAGKLYLGPEAEITFSDFMWKVQESKVQESARAVYDQGKP